MICDGQRITVPSVAEFELASQYVVSGWRHRMHWFAMDFAACLIKYGWRSPSRQCWTYKSVPIKDLPLTF
jgi:hypothetical protein